MPDVVGIGRRPQCRAMVLANLRIGCAVALASRRRPWSRSCGRRRDRHGVAAAGLSLAGLAPTLEARLRARRHQGGGARDQFAGRLARAVLAHRQAHPRAGRREEACRSSPSPRMSPPPAAIGWPAPADEIYRRRSLDRRLDRRHHRRLRLSRTCCSASASSGASTPPARAKRMLDPFRPEKPEDVARLKRAAAGHPRQLQGAGARRRGARLKGDDGRRCSAASSGPAGARSSSASSTASATCAR